MILDQTSAHPLDLIQANARADTAAANGDAALDLAGNYGLAERNHEIGIIIVGLEFMRAEISHFMARCAQPADQLVLEFETAVIRCNSYSHKPWKYFRKQGRASRRKIRRACG